MDWLIGIGAAVAVLMLVAFARSGDVSSGAFPGCDGDDPAAPSREGEGEP